MLSAQLVSKSARLYCALRLKPIARIYHIWPLRRPNNYFSNYLLSTHRVWPLTWHTICMQLQTFENEISLFNDYAK